MAVMAFVELVTGNECKRSISTLYMHFQTTLIVTYDLILTLFDNIRIFLKF